MEDRSAGRGIPDLFPWIVDFEMPEVGRNPMAESALVSAATVAWMCYLRRATFVTPEWEEAEVVLPL